MPRNILITGSARGIGLAVARVFAAGGDRIVLNARTDQAALDAACAELGAVGFLADLSDYETARRVFADIGDRFGPLDVLVNNAGAPLYGLFTETTPADWAACMAHNVDTVFHCTHLAVPAMVRRKRGTVVNVSSVWGSVGASCEAVYSAAKGAVHAFTKAMARELAPSGIRVNAVACGAIDTRMNEHLSPAEKADFTEHIPLGRFGNADEIAQLVHFLASDAAAYLTGQIIHADGGMT